MRNGFARILRIGISRTGLALALSGGWPRSPAKLLCDLPLREGESPAMLLASALAEHKAAARLATVVVADDLARLFMVTPPQNAVRLADCEAAAQMRFQSLYGESSDDWLLQADWDATRPFLACALPKALVHALYQVAKEQRLTLLGVAPRFIISWNSRRKQLTTEAWLGVAAEGMLTLGAIDRHRLCAIRAIPVPPQGWRDAQWLPEQIGREALRLNLQMPQQLLLCGHLPDYEINESIGPLACVRLDAGQHATSGSRFSLACSGIHR